MTCANGSRFPGRALLRSRSGAPVKLGGLLDDAVSRAAAIVAEKNPHLPDEERAGVAHSAGIGAVKYADLSTDRTRDYVFDLDRMLRFDGNTAPYLQYAHARARSILRRAEPASTPDGQRVLVTEPAERALVLAVLDLAGSVAAVTRTLEFHRLAAYLHGLASAFARFVEHCPVLRAPDPVRGSRLVLCDLTARPLDLGLGLLGIDAPDRM